MDLGLKLAGAEKDGEKKAWRDIRSAGQGVGSIRDLPEAADPIGRIRKEHLVANVAQPAHSVRWVA